VSSLFNYGGPSSTSENPAGDCFFKVGPQQRLLNNSNVFFLIFLIVIGSGTPAGANFQRSGEEKNKAKKTREIFYLFETRQSATLKFMSGAHLCL